jgi:tetraacyldisaccharide 4'-kinase
MKLKKPKFWDLKQISLWALLLIPFSFLFQLVLLLEKFFKKPKNFSVPVICVGNIYLGGTGKTPLTLELFKIIKSIGKNPGFIKKGYDYLDDEIKMLEKIGKVYTDKSREKAINSLISSNYNVAILDDGFQDYSIKKNFSILCFNSRQLIGNGFTIPSGPLRESIKSLKRADCVLINGEKNIKFENKINKFNNNIKIFYSKYKLLDTDVIQNKKVIALAGIGNPENFFDQLKEKNIDLIKTYSYPDHHNFSKKELKNIIDESEKNNAVIVTTEKDHSRMNEEIKLIIKCIKVDLEIENKNDFINLIKSKI